MALLAKHAIGKGGPDTIFAFSGMANARAAEVGKEHIINATIGAFLEPDGSLKTMETVERALRDVSFKAMANYAPIDGLPTYLEAMTEAVFREAKPEAYTAAIATPGGTGALHNTFYNYLEAGEACLTTDYFWGNYRTLLEEIDRKLETFPMFQEDGSFNLEALEQGLKDLAARQEHLMLLLNTPAHNPTGYTIEDSTWDAILDLLKGYAEQERPVVLLLDVAYLDYAAPEARQFFKKFSNLPENLLVVVAASMSKGFTLYGFRLGVMIGITSSEKVRDEFALANGASARGTWSNCSRPAMEILLAMRETPEKWQAFCDEQQAFADILARRAKIFMDEAKEVGLPLLPYDAGFFFMIPTKDHDEAERVAAELRKIDVFMVPLGSGVRVAICAIDDASIKGLAAKCKKAYDAACNF